MRILIDSIRKLASHKSTYVGFVGQLDQRWLRRRDIHTEEEVIRYHLDNKGFPKTRVECITLLHVSVEAVAVVNINVQLDVISVSECLSEVTRITMRTSERFILDEMMRERVVPNSARIRFAIQWTL